MDLHVKLKFAFCVEEAGMDDTTIFGEANVVTHLAVEIALGIGTDDADTATGDFIVFLEVEIGTLVLPHGGGKVLGGVPHFGFEKSGPGQVIEVCGDASRVSKLNGILGILGHIFG